MAAAARATVLVLGEAEAGGAAPADAAAVWGLVEEAAAGAGDARGGGLRMATRRAGPRGLALGHGCAAPACGVAVEYAAPRRPAQRRFSARITLEPQRACADLQRGIHGLLAARGGGGGGGGGGVERGVRLQFREVTGGARAEDVQEARAAKARRRLAERLDEIRASFALAQQQGQQQAGSGALVLAKRGLGSGAEQLEDLELVCALAHEHGTRSLDLSRNALEDRHVRRLVRLARTSRRLCSVLLAGNKGVTREARQELEGELALNALAGSADDPDGLRSLNQRDLGDAGAAIVAQGLSSAGRLLENPAPLQFLGLAKANIGRAGAEALADALESENAASIRVLEVYSNVPGPHWAEVCARLIRRGRLASIDVGSNGVDDRGAALVAEALAAPSGRLEELHLDYNQVTDVGLAALAGAAAGALGLHTLWMHGNPVSAQRREALEGVLRPRQQARLGLPTREWLALDLEERAEAIAGERPFSRRCEAASPQDLADEIASLCGEAYGAICAGHASFTLGRAVLAAIVEARDDVLTVVSLGVGTRFVDARLVAMDRCGDRVKDSHAEVLARRGLRKYLASQLALASKAQGARGRCDPGVVEAVQGTGPEPFRVRPGVLFHLYTSLAPCGAASSQSLDPELPCCKGGAGRACAVYREGERHSCTDKIRRWAAQGLQGKALARYLGKTPLGLVVVGQKWSPRCAETVPGAVGSRTGLEALQGKTFQDRGDSDASFAWWSGLEPSKGPISFDGKTGLTIDAKVVPLCPRWLTMEVDEAAGHGAAT